MDRTGTQVGSSEPHSIFGNGCDNKLSYPRDNSVISGKSPYRPRCLPPRCWIAVSSWCRS